MSGTCFLTGGTGFVGGAILRRLLEDGRRVRALARTEEGARRLAGLGAEPVRGDLLDLASLQAGAAGAEVVYHAAGLNAFCLPDPCPLREVNVVGSVNVVRAAARAGARRVVYTSSAAAIGEERGTVGREDSPHRGWYLSEYERSKHLAERAVFEAGAEHGIEVVSVNPSSVQGPGRTGGTARLFLAFLNGRLRVAVRTRLSVVDVRDCAEGHLLAEGRGRPGHRYLLNGATLGVEEALDLLGSLTGVRTRPAMLPGWAAMGMAAAAEGIGRLTRRRVPICREVVRTLLHGHAYDGSRACRELGLTYTPIEETLRTTAAWYVERGLVRRPLPGLARG